MLAINRTSLFLATLALALGVTASAVSSGGVMGARAQALDAHRFTTANSTDPGWFPAEPTAFPGPYKKADQLPTGEWHVMANGRIYTLTITAVSRKGEVSAKFSSGDVTGAWWEPGNGTGELTFTRVLPGLSQEFTGYLMRYDEQDPKYRMAGTFGGSRKGGHEAGWYATLPRN